jgi:hypothetical protein
LALAASLCLHQHCLCCGHDEKTEVTGADRKLE